MFYYLHLTRPPPEQASPYQPLLITPNIANDLRTEFPSPGPGTEGGIDIFYAWVKCIDGDAQKQRTLGPMTQPLKLMTWNGNSYKEVQVFPPKEAAGSDTSRWSLLLCTRSSSPGNPYITSIDLSAGDFGNHIFPILSAPVHFVSGSRTGTGRSNNQKIEPTESRKNTKQVRNERLFKLPSPLFNSPTVGPLRVTEHLSYDLDKKVWDSGVGLSNWLVSAMLEASRIDSDELADGIPSIVKSLMRTKRATFVELGTGTGLVSIVLATLLSHCPEQPQSKIIATDLPSAMELLEVNLSDNAAYWHTPNSSSSSIQLAVLDWNEEDEEKQFPTEIQESGVDFIIMADVTYNTASFPSLIRTLSRLSTRAHRSPSVLLAYKERDPDERRLWDMARGIGLHFDEIGRVPGAGDVPVEIYQGRFERRNERREK
ncbi:hypothetical protein ACEPAI_3873 [Sanghuangporus weigelae]